ncbi:MAG: DNA-binding protein [Candidatus Omnitrophica bacterium]|nr:DNA-binding protein [Candidatus Omnitrophota bacterium]
MRYKSQVTSHKSQVQFKSKKLKIFCFYIVLFTFAFLLLPYFCYAQTISSSELINNTRQYDGKIVVYEGEVIGDVMARGRQAWLNVHDGNNAIGIWIDKDLTADILYTGSYKSRGDWVEISGIFQRACAQHGGDLDIHAQTIRKISPGRIVQEKLNPGKLRLALILLGILCLILILTLLRRK